MVVVDAKGILRKVLGDPKVLPAEMFDGGLGEWVAEVVFVYDVSGSNPNGSYPENMPRVISSTGQVYATQESYKRRGKDYAKRVLDGRGLYEEIPQGKVTDKVTLWVSGRAVTADKRFEEIVGPLQKIGKKVIVTADAIRYFLSAAIDAISFGAVVPVGGNINLTGPFQLMDAVSVHPTEVIPEAGNAAFATEGSGQKSIRQEYKVPYALMVGGGMFIGGYLTGNVFSSENENIKGVKLGEFFGAEHLEFWIRAIWSGFAAQYQTTSKKIRPVALVVMAYKSPYPKYFIARKMQEGLFDRFKSLSPAGLPDVRDELVKVLQKMKGDGASVWVWKEVLDGPEFSDGEDITLR